MPTLPLNCKLCVLCEERKARLSAERRSRLPGGPSQLDSSTCTRATNRTTPGSSISEKFTYNPRPRGRLSQVLPSWQSIRRTSFVSDLPSPDHRGWAACAAVTICTNRTEGVYRCCATRAVRQHTAPLCPVHPVEAKQVHERPRPDSGRELCADERVGAERLRRPRGDSENCTPARETTCPRGTRTLRRIEEAAPAIETAASKQGAAVQPPGPYTPHTQG